MGLLIAVEVLLAVARPVRADRSPCSRGWLVAFAIWSMVPVGSMTLLMIHRLTGGEWGRAAAPVLQPAAAMLPLVALAFVPVLVGLTDIYPWAADPSTIPPDVARWYLSGSVIRSPGSRSRSPAGRCSASCSPSASGAVCSPGSGWRFSG